MGLLARILAPKPGDIFETGATADMAVAVPFAMNKEGKRQSMQGVKVLEVICRLFKDQQVKEILTSGGHQVNGGPTEGDWAANYLRGKSIPPDSVWTENRSCDTRGNAVETLTKLASPSSIPTVVLVVQELQAKRALATFRQAAQEQRLRAYFWVLPVQDEVWNDNAKRTLRHPLIFFLREVFLAWPLFKLKGWV